jgi:hypothetical protein
MGQFVMHRENGNPGAGGAGSRPPGKPNLNG